MRDAEVTLWFGNLGSPGYWATKNATRDYKRPFYENPDRTTLLDLAERYEVWNVAGNRASTNPQVGNVVRAAFYHLIDAKE